jgi:hypothetical protein
MPGRHSMGAKLGRCALQAAPRWVQACAGTASSPSPSPGLVRHERPNCDQAGPPTVATKSGERTLREVPPQRTSTSRARLFAASVSRATILTS